MALLTNQRLAPETACAFPQARRRSSWDRHARAALITLVIILMLISSTATRTQAQDPNGEYTLKAAFLYNFAKFVEWPSSTFAETTSPFVLCTLGHDPFGTNLDAIAGKMVRERSLVIKRIRSEGTVTGCQMLYVSPSELTQATDLLRSLHNTPVLTVCDIDNCAEAGIILGMRLVDNRVQLDMNLETLQHTPLKVSSQLMKLTRIVKGNP